MRRIRPVALAVVLAMVAGLVCSCSCSENPADKLDPEVARALKPLHVWCPHCQRAYVVEKKQAEAVPGTEPIFLKALKIPCPTCKKTDGEEAIQCVHCDEYVPVVVKKGERGLLKCPGCGKYPYGDGPPISGGGRPSLPPSNR